jgi:hypothetical protein
VDQYQVTDEKMGIRFDPTGTMTRNILFGWSVR